MDQESPKHLAAVPEPSPSGVGDGSREGQVDQAWLFLILSGGEAWRRWSVASWTKTNQLESSAISVQHEDFVRDGLGYNYAAKR